jgi:serine/threonine protein kinase
MATVTHNETTWTLGNTLGKGLSGEVRVAVRSADQKRVSVLLLFVVSFSQWSSQFAMKVVDFPALVAVFRDFDVTADTLESNLMREIEVMRRLRHRNIIYLDDSFWIDTKLYMSMELVEGKDLLRSITPGGLKEEVAKDYFFQLCSAISYCHSNNVCANCDFFLFFSILTQSFQVIHGDLKPENILIRDKDHRLKLIDFGFSHIVKPGEHLEVLLLLLPFSRYILFSYFHSLSGYWRYSFVLPP